MKKINLISILGFMFVFLLAGDSEAVTFSLNDTALLQLWDVNENPVNAVSSLFFVTDNPAVYGGTMLGTVGFVGTLYSTFGSPDYPYAEMQIGANSNGVSPILGTTGATTAKVIGDSLGIAPTNSLAGFDVFSLKLANDDDDSWMVSLYLYTGTGEANKYQTGWTTLTPGTGTTMSIDLTTVAELNNVTNIGFSVKANLTGQSGNPSNPDTFHFSASSTVPEPGTLLLMGAGLFGLVMVTNKGFADQKTKKKTWII